MVNCILHFIIIIFLNPAFQVSVFHRDIKEMFAIVNNLFFDNIKLWRLD